MPAPSTTLAARSMLACLSIFLVLEFHRCAGLAPAPRKPPCDFTAGAWVPVPTRLPRYSGDRKSPNFCKYMRALWNCDSRRPDREYQKYAWAPYKCNMGFLRPTGFKYLMRNKRMLIVGDSLMVNTYEALLCLLSMGRFTMMPLKKLSYGGQRTFKGYHFKEFNFTLEFHFSPYLARAEMGPRGPRGGGHGYTVSVDELDPALVAALPFFDVAVFGTGVWWQQTVPGRVQRNKYVLGGRARNMSDVYAHAIALQTLSKHIYDTDFKGVPYFFTISPKHAVPWRGPGACGALKPAQNAKSLLRVTATSALYYVDETVILKRSPIRTLRVTRMSQLRPEAHIGLWTPLGSIIATNTARPLLGDCTHWCLPGVPDAWLDFLYANMKLEPYLYKL